MGIFCGAPVKTNTKIIKSRLERRLIDMTERGRKKPKQKANNNNSKKNNNLLFIIKAENPPRQRQRFRNHSVGCCRAAAASAKGKRTNRAANYLKTCNCICTIYIYSRDSHIYMQQLHTQKERER